MTKLEAIEKLNGAGIHQLRQGESLKDALDYVDGEIASRKGHQVKFDNGKKMDRNQIIGASNREAFAKTVVKPEYVGGDVDDYDEDEYYTLEDNRENTDVIGELQPCQYCGTMLHVDKGSNYDILNCDDCMTYAIWDNCM